MIGPSSPGTGPPVLAGDGGWAPQIAHVFFSSHVFFHVFFSSQKKP
jgi:hypothetical protein